MSLEIFKSLNGFNHIEFEEGPHVYKSQGLELISVTSVIELYKSDKDWEEIAMRYAAKNGLSLDSVQKQWALESTIGKTRGSEFHLYVENCIANKKYVYNPDIMPEALETMWWKFWEESKDHLVPVRSEFIVGDMEFGVCGMVDQIFWNTKEEELQIWDWKTNKKIDMSNKWNKMKSPVGHLDECEYTFYSLQLAIYKRIIEKNIGLDIGNCYLGHFHTNNDSYKLYKTRELKKEVDLILSNVPLFKV